VTARRAAFWIVGLVTGAAILYVGFIIAANMGVDISF